jgi:DNA-binding response OmpR family regulator
MAAEPDPKPRVLLIDDDEGLREVFELFMRKEGFHVAAAEDGEIGLAKAAVFRPHLIVVDLMMPRLNGFEVIHRLQAGDLARIPVIVMTGFSETANEQLIRQEPNVLEFLSKPVDYAALARRIREALQGAATRD